MEIFNDLREFIDKIEALGDCKIIEGADWDLEIGAITDLLATIPNSPLLIFDKVKGCKTGYRVASNLFSTHKRTALGLGLPTEAEGIEMVKAMRKRLGGGIKPLPPVQVDTGPIKENIKVGNEVDLLEFPTPRWRELDGGRYIGTGSVTIMRDPDEGWVNAAPYRVQVHDKSTATISIALGRNGDIIQRKYFDRGLCCPAAVTCGQEPMLWAVSNFSLPWGSSEYDYAGWFRGKPVEVVKGVTTDLPIPATAEIVLEGEIVPPEVETRIEGPFGEWAGYYAGRPRPVPAFRVKSVLHRNDPIIQGNPSSRFPSVWSLGRHIHKAAVLWDELDSQLPGVKGTWVIEDAGVHSIVVISIEQMYGGHARQAAMVTAGSSATALCCRFIIVVDEDIKPSNISEVLWALGTRCDPETSIDIVRGCWGARTDPMLSPVKRDLGDFTHSTAIVLACKPYHWKKDFPPSLKMSPELLEKTKRKWAHLFQ